MPAGLGAGRLGLLGPTPEEVEQAKLIIKQANPAQMRSKMSSMVQWLKSFPDSDVTTSRGAQRQQYLESFVVHQLRSKNQQKKSEHVTKKSHDNQAKAAKRFWNEERIVKELGPKKAAAIIGRSGAKYRPCRYTGSVDEELREYEVVSDEEAEITTDHNSWNISAAGDATEADMKMMAEMTGARGSEDFHVPDTEPQVEAAQTQAGGVVVKKEQTSIADAQKEKVKQQYHDFNNRAREHHCTFSKMQVDLVDMENKLSEHRFTDELRTALKKHMLRVGSLVRLLLKATSQKPRLTEFPKLLAAMEVVNKNNDDFKKEAENFGIAIKKQKRRRITT